MQGVLVRTNGMGRPGKHVDLNRVWADKVRKRGGYKPVSENDWAFCRLRVAEEKIRKAEKKYGGSMCWESVEARNRKVHAAFGKVVCKLFGGEERGWLVEKGLHRFEKADDERLQALINYFDRNAWIEEKLGLDLLSLQADARSLMRRVE